MSQTKTPREELFIAVPRELFYANLSVHGFMVAVYILEQLDYNTGILKTDAREICHGMNLGGTEKLKLRSVRRGLAEVVAAGIVKSFWKKGLMLEYPILWEGYRVRQGALKGCILDAKATLDPKKPVYHRPKAPEPTIPSVTPQSVNTSKNEVTQNNTDKVPSVTPQSLKAEISDKSVSPSLARSVTPQSVIIQEYQEHQENQSILQSLKDLNDRFAKAAGKGLGMGKRQPEFVDLVRGEGTEVMIEAVLGFAADPKHNFGLIKYPANMFLSQIDDYLPIARIKVAASKPQQVRPTNLLDDFAAAEPDGLLPSERRYEL